MLASGLEAVLSFLGDLQKLLPIWVKHPGLIALVHGPGMNRTMMPILSTSQFADRVLAEKVFKHKHIKEKIM